MKRRDFLKTSALLTVALASPALANVKESKMITLNNGVKMPLLGLGMWDLRGDECESVVKEAIKIGYRSFDSAQMYRNEAELGAAIKSAVADGLVSRDELFITTKLVATSAKEASAKIDESLAKLGKIDLMLIHWPGGSDLEVWRALEAAANEKKLGSIGLSNFYGAGLDEILNNAKIQPVLNQCQTHIYQQNNELRAQMSAKKVALEAYSPFGGARHVKEVLADKTLEKIAAAHSASPAQIVIAWMLSEGIITIPKTSKVKRLQENFDAQKITLTSDELKAIKALDKGENLRLW